VLARRDGPATLSLGHQQFCGDDSVISWSRQRDNEQNAIFLADFIFGLFIGHIFTLISIFKVFLSVNAIF
jgi:hypothetical protein